MSQAILISNNEVINSLYEVNLRAYVATNVTIKKSVDSALGLLEQSPNIDAIICFGELADISKKKTLTDLKNFLNEKSLNIPIVILGEPKTAIEKSIVINNKFDIKSMLKAMAKILQLTAVDMASKIVPKYFPIPISLFKEIESAECNIYFRNQLDDFEYEYFVIIEKDTRVEDGLAKYLKDGVEHFYVDSADRLHFINKASVIVLQELNNENLPLADRIEVTKQGMGIVAEQIFENPEVTSEIAEISKACIASMGQVVKEVPKLKNLLSMLMENKGDYVYKHSVLTTYIASEIINHISWGNDEQKYKVAFALFFHDIYLVPIYQKYSGVTSEEDLLFNDEVTDADKQVILEHAKLAGNLVKTFSRCPMGADMIVTQHHGMTSGQGFAVNYKDDISPLAKIIIISEDVCEEIMAKEADLPSGKKLKVNVENIVDRLAEKYRSHSYKKVIDAFRQCKF